MASILDDYQGGLLGSDFGKGAKLPQSRKEKLQAELKLLEWHKMANNAAIKSALLQTKSLKTQSSQQRTSQHNEDDAKWMKKIIQEENIKPLEVSKDYVLDYEKREKENSDRVASQVDRHITTLKSLRMKLEARNDLKSRTDEYREWQRGFLPKKHAVMIGKTLEEIEGPNEANKHAHDDDDINDELLQRSLRKSQYGHAGGQHQSSQELNTVLDSLSRLAQLEQRISSLEHENQHDYLLAKETPGAGQRSPVDYSPHKQGGFKKMRVSAAGMQGMATRTPGQGPRAGDKNPMGLVYAVNDPLLSKKQNKARQSNWKANAPSAGQGLSAVRALQQRTTTSMNPNKGVFLTAQPSEDQFLGNDQRETQRREQRRQQYQQPAGATHLRSLIKSKKGRLKENAIGDQRHAMAMAEMQQRKQQQLARARGVSQAARNNRLLPNKGAGAGVKTKNKHLAAFMQDKQRNERRTDDLKNRKGGMQRAPPPQRKQQPNVNNNIVLRSNALEQRLASQTTPAYMSGSNKNNKTNMTRRVAGESVPLGKVVNPPAVAVTGMGGLRVLRGQRAAASAGQPNARR